MKTRGIFLKRTHTIISEDKKGNPIETKEKKWFPIRINNEIPWSHKDFQSNS